MRFAILLTSVLAAAAPLGGGEKSTLPERYQFLAKGATTRLTRVWGTPEQHVFLPTRVAFSRDGKTALVASAELGEKDSDDFISVLDVATAATRRTLTIKKAVATALAISADGKYALGGTFAGEPGKATVTLLYWDLADGKIIHEGKGPKEAIVALAFSGDGSQALAAGADGAVQLWDVKAGKLLHTLEGHPKGTMAVAFSPGGRQALTGGQDGVVRLWDLKTGNSVQTFQTKLVPSALGFLPDGNRFLAVSMAAEPALWDIKEKKELRQFKKDLVGNGPSGLALSEDGKRFVRFMATV